MNLIVKTPQLAVWNGREMRCAIGHGGIARVADKAEGDGKTPVGIWSLREVFYRADRVAAPVTVLPLHVMQPDDAWCDIVESAHYNRHVVEPHLTLHEKLWRDDHLYDIVAVMGFNDAPVVPGRGSAIFLHPAPPDFRPSEGCVTLALDDLRTVLREATAATCVEVLAPA